MFKDRQEAGKLLASKLKEMGCKFDVVLAVPRGGIIIGDEIAKVFSCSLDVVMAKKIGSPDLPEYVAGAVTPDGEVLIHEKVQEIMNISESRLRQLANTVQDNIIHRLSTYRSFRKPVNIEDKKILVVDDGIASGFTMKAAINYLKRQKVKEINIAVPVASQDAYLSLRDEVNQMVVLEIPEKFYAVGQLYKNFTAVEDYEVIKILKARTI